MILGLAPMDWYTDCAFRQIVKEIFDEYGEKDRYELILRTEFMNADGYVINPTWVIKHLLTDKNQSPVIAQIFWGDEEMLLKCFKDIQNKYFHNWKLKIENWKFSFAGIELNMGCPARNVMHTGWGSALLKNRDECLRIIKNAWECLHVPFSIKTRTGLNDEDKKDQMEFLVEASKYVDMITIHWRTVKQGYSWECNRDFIYELKKKINKNCKVIWNWGIRSYDDIETLKGNLDWIMIGQWAIGNPRIFTPHTPSREEIKETILRHLDYMIIYEQYFQEHIKKFKWKLSMPTEKSLNEIRKLPTKDYWLRVILEFRKHLFQYVKWIPWSKEFKQKVSMITEYEQLVEETQKFFA